MSNFLGNVLWAFGLSLLAAANLLSGLYNFHSESYGVATLNFFAMFFAAAVAVVKAKQATES